MKKILSLLITVSCISGLLAQQPDSVRVADTNSESGLKTVVDYLLKNKELLEIRLDTRFDYQAKFNEHETQESGFRGQTLKIWFTGEIAPGVRYRVRHRLNKPQNPLERDNLSGATDLAYIELDAGKNWTFRIGKQVVQFGTFEFDYLPSDVYLTTTCYDDLDAFKTGLNVAYKTGKQVFNLQVVNSDAPQFSTEKYKNKSLAGLFVWEGNLFNDLIKTRFGYGAFQHDSSKYYSWLTLGTKVTVNKFMAEMDWYMGDRNMNFSSVVPTVEGYRPVRDQSASLNLRYDFGKIKSLVKGTWNKRRDQLTSSNYMTGGVQAGVEYYPFTNPLLKDLRFHAVYAYTRTNYNGDFKAMEGINQNMIIVGTRWMFKIM
ncbi:porin [Apibacter raozihei]|uniref:porin n=1 Tax=Apibacter raozihei TaxID=2500547 RepID=UPI000FE2F229|nr:porin [Apibacter raozihei]